jgi:hypothetical protein
VLPPPPPSPPPPHRDCIGGQLYQRFATMSVGSHAGSRGWCGLGSYWIVMLCAPYSPERSLYVLFCFYHRFRPPIPPKHTSNRENYIYQRPTHHISSVVVEGDEGRAEGGDIIETFLYMLSTTLFYASIERTCFTITLPLGKVSNILPHRSNEENHCFR